jgi:hypothetical protein
MDPIHSVDTIYQSMFRVLTERPGKKRGFFIDLLKERLIKFIYKYDNYTNKSLKKPINIDSQLIRFKSQLFSWNVNAINNYERSEQEYSSIYDKLITSFNLDDKNKFIENIEKYQHDTNIEKILETIPKITNTIYQNLKYIGLDFSSKDTSRKSIIKKLLERTHEPVSGKEVGKEATEGKNDATEGVNEATEGMKDSTDEEEVEEKKEEKLTKKEQNKRNKIVMDYIKNIFSLYALLIDDKEYCDIDNIKDLKKLLIKKITVTDLKNLCDFSKDTEVNYSLLDCYISFLKQFETKFDAKELLLIKDSGKTEEDMKLEILQIYKTQIIILVDNLEDNFEKTNDMLKLYCYYKDKLNMIKKNISTQGNIISSRCGVSNNNNNNMKGGAKEFIKETEINETVLETIRKYLSVRDEEKKLFGEVFTPIELVCEMLDKLPQDVWKDPKLKWLDPANGIGNYPVVAYYKLMDGLKGVKGFEKESDRSKHIIENMLFMVELNPVNCKVCKKVFKMIDEKTTPNIYNSNFLEWSKTSGKYDIIMGNPPYNKGWEGRQGGVLWKDFVFTSLDLLQKNGYLTFVHPQGWRKPFTEGDRENNAGRVWNIFKQFNLIFVKISDKKIQNFPKVDYYVFQNKKVLNFETRVINEFNIYTIDETINVSNLQFIPNFVSKLSLSILNKLLSKSGDKFNVIYDQSFKAVKKDTKFIANAIEHYWVPKSDKSYEITYKKYTEIPEYVRLPKIILTRMAGSSALHNKLFAKFYTKHIGTTSATMYQLVSNSNEGIKYEKYFNSNLLTFLIKITQYTDGQFAKNEFKILNLISKPTDLKNNPTDQDIYKYYKITKEEQQLIEEIVTEHKTEPKKTKKKSTDEASSAGPAGKTKKINVITSKTKSKKNKKKCHKIKNKKSCIKKKYCRYIKNKCTN